MALREPQDIHMMQCDNLRPISAFLLQPGLVMHTRSLGSLAWAAIETKLHILFYE